MHQSDYRRCFQHWKSLWNKIIQAEWFWFRMDQYVMKVTSLLLVPQHQTGCFLIRPGEGHLDFYPYIRKGCVHLISLVNMLPASKFRAPVCETAVLG